MSESGASASGAESFDALVVGAGLSGAVVARELAQLGKKVLVIDKREHACGNCFDFVDKNGFRVALYGPHFFHTVHARVWEYVNRFSEWVPWEHRVLARVETEQGDKHVPVPCNIDTVNDMFGLNIKSEEEMDAWLKGEQIPCADPKDSREVALSRVGQRLYDLLFKGYSRKQWAKWPEELEPSVLARIPVRNNWDDRYFTDTWQGLPKDGYTKFVGNILKHENITVRLNQDFFTYTPEYKASFGRIFYTGPIDRYFEGLGLPKLEYRSLTFAYETVEVDPSKTWQPVSQVNYPAAEIPFTRITEYKHLPNNPEGAGSNGVSTIVKEYSTGEGEPFYPVPAPANRELYEKYRAAAEKEPGVVFVGRLASYKYFNMDQAILNALQCTDKEIHGREELPGSYTESGVVPPSNITTKPKTGPTTPSA